MSAPAVAGVSGELQGLSLAERGLAGEAPVELFLRWRRDAHQAQLVMADSTVITTSTRTGMPSARTVCFRRMDQGRFVFLTDSRSKKCREMAENPGVAVDFLWAFLDGQDRRVVREVAMQGETRRLAATAYEDLYWAQIPNRRIRAHICEQGAEADWQQLKQRHDQLLEELSEGKELPMPGHFVAYEFHPSSMEFYEQVDKEETECHHFCLIKEGSWRKESLCSE